jgi:hypothetical protein
MNTAKYEHSEHPDKTIPTNIPQSYKDFLDYLYIIGSESTSEEELDRLYNEEVYIEFDHHTITLPFDAVLYNALLSLMETVVKEY